LQLPDLQSLSCSQLWPKVQLFAHVGAAQLFLLLQFLDAHSLSLSQPFPCKQNGVQVGIAHLKFTQWSDAHSPFTAHWAPVLQVGEQL